MTKKPNWYIPFGSEAHRALVGMLQDKKLSPEEKQNTEDALKMKPEPTADESKKPITPQNYAPRTSQNPGDEIIDGWKRVGR